MSRSSKSTLIIVLVAIAIVGLIVIITCFNYLKTPEEALDILYKAIQESGYINEVKIGLDVASSTFFKVNLIDLLVQKPLIKLHNENISLVIGGIKTGANELAGKRLRLELFPHQES
jgi:hypothetical protein